MGVGICCCAPTLCSLCFTVTGPCSPSPVVGAAVSVLSGMTVVATGTTNSSGIACVSVAAGSYTYSISGAGYATATGSVTVTCPTTSKAVTMSLASGFMCNNVPGSCCYPHPLPTTLHVTYGGVFFTLPAVTDASLGHFAWAGSGSLSTGLLCSSTRSSCPPTGPPAFIVTQTTGNTCVWIGVGCDSDGAGGTLWRLAIFMAYWSVNTGCAPATTTIVVAAPISCDPGPYFATVLTDCAGFAAVGSHVLCTSRADATYVSGGCDSNSNVSVSFSIPATFFNTSMGLTLATVGGGGGVTAVN